MRNWLSEKMEAFFHFVDFLRALPNLAGLQIYHGLSTSLVPIISYAFASITLPVVTALSIPDSLDGILHAFPNVTVLACPTLSADSKLLAPAKAHFLRLKALAGLRIYKVRDYQNLIPALSREFPHLGALSVASAFLHKSEDLLTCLCAFKHLRQLELVYQASSNFLSSKP
ncbi:hypothetical protein B0H13DRAFT_2501710 [Mycena leptocephala]|nr:hypothetical protein B0H13DRAFT_2501710 [Mycena leptocephala]